jgi:P-type conjugative transfer ATPase TrbB
MAELSKTTSRFTDMLDHVLKPIQAYLDDHEVTDIAANSDGRVWVKRFSSPWESTSVTMLASDRRMVIDLLASRQMDELSAERPSLSTTLPSGERIECTIPPLAEAAIFAIRQRARVIYTLEDFEADGIVTGAQVDILRRLVHEHRNVMIAGPVGSAKTTLLNAMLLEVDPIERMVVIEDVDELQLTLPNLVRLLTREGVADLRALVRKSLRLQIDRLVVGETRGAEALDLIKGWNTGHSGLCTIHADSTRGALSRLEMLVQEAVAVVPRDLIAQTVHAVCSMASVTGGKRPRVVSIDRVEGIGGNGEYITTPLREGGGHEEVERDR